MRSSPLANLWKVIAGLLLCGSVWIVIARGRKSPVMVTGNSSDTATTAPTRLPRDPDAAPRQPQPACIVIDGQRIDFPRAKLVIEKIDDATVAVLSSDRDPGSTNSFYFRMMLDAESPKDFAQADWSYSEPPGDRSDSPYGIFLNGQGQQPQQIQPMDVSVSFDKARGGLTLVSISGQFVLTQTQDPSVAPRVVKVAGEVEAATIIKD